MTSTTIFLQPRSQARSAGTRAHPAMAPGQLFAARRLARAVESVTACMLILGFLVLTILA
jgi:hypothetical protein